MSIKDWREEIDAIDAELLRLLNMRARLAVRVGESSRPSKKALRTSRSRPSRTPSRVPFNAHTTCS
jgi:chorismate mutase